MTGNLIRLSTGTIIDGWHVVKELGNGGFAVVYLVEKSGAQYALKLARHREASGDEKQTHRRVLQELSIITALSHPNIVSHRGSGYAETGNVYLALEYVDGWTLGEWKERKHATAHEILRVFVKIVSALAYIHERGILHRDLKPANVLIRKSDGEPVIIDFSGATYALADDLTDGGLPPGTDRFRAPEQFKFLAEHKDERRARYSFQVADEIFAVGAMLYELLTDPRPTEHRARSPLNDLTISPLPARKVNPRVPEALSDVVESTLSRDPRRRPVDTIALQRELEDLLTDPGADYAAPVHPPSELRQAGPSEGETPLPVEPASKPRSRRLGALAVAGGAAVVVAVVAALWLAPGEAPAPAAESRAVASPVPPSSSPSMLPETALPDMSPPGPAPGVDAGPSTAAVHKEGSTVKTQSPEAQKQPRTGRAGRAFATPTVSVGLPLCAVLLGGCPGVQVRPEPFDCPAGTRETMRKELGWTAGDRFSLSLDDRHKQDEVLWFSAGAEVVGVVPEGYGESNGPKAPAGTRFYGGKVYLIPEKNERKHYPAVVVKYERVKVPGKDEVPVCFVVETNAREVKGTAGRARNGTNGVVRADGWVPR
ncbi:serine/threonine protein kinase [Pyxidicoccus fallax]|uniref:non-specific serine/threonine protein kinase n=1 Tax=Pyxidicoccus fallax TaxID=394095 RepID=A0A848LID5_9BACT|nr:serine/threonine-protein kinase [Pyxidicoccus fallax]NMO17482.1 serine/threonine protein kinase [Pyxidicoccus fallax]NPC77723.1 serine/threonine protein kinase [Pyxidicoccus fallax]